MNYKYIAGTSLFSGVSEEEAKAMLTCLEAEEKSFLREQMIYHTGQTVWKMGLLLKGSVNIIRMDVWGNESIIGHIAQGEAFAETYACLPNQPILVDVMAVTASTVLFMDVRKVVQTCASSCHHHNQLIHNLLMLMASRNLGLTQKINHVTHHSIRDRLLSYFAQETGRQNSREIEIPFNRQQLADYLAVDRSALSNELSKMQKEGLIQYKKNHFVLK